MDDKKIMDLLQAPFLPSEIEWRVGSTTKDKTKGLALAYVTNRAIQNRLDDVFGCFGWRNEFKEWKSTSQICGISVWHEERSQWITKWDGSDDSATEAVKGGLSDSMKRCGYQWGIGRYLYNLPQTWVALKSGKYLAEVPKLPTWALPKDFKGNQNIKTQTMPETTHNHAEGKEDKKTANTITKNKSSLELVCESCGKGITEKVGMFSTSKYGKKLCMDCQKKEVK